MGGEDQILELIDLAEASNTLAGTTLSDGMHHCSTSLQSHDSTVCMQDALPRCFAVTVELYR